MIFTFITFFAIFNGLRGGKRITKPLYPFGIAILCAILDYVLNDNLTQSLIIFIGLFLSLWIAVVPEVGKYFGIFDGDLKSYDEVGIKVIDNLTSRIISNDKNPLAYKRWCLVAFTLRSTLFYLPFLLLAYYHPISAIYGLGVFSMGAIYAIGGYAPLANMVRFSEISYGALLGYLFYMSIS